MPDANSYVSNPMCHALANHSCRMFNRFHMMCQVIINGSQSMHAVAEAGVSVANANHKELLQLKTWDVSLVSPGSPTPFPNGLFAPEMEKGVHFNLMNNIWGTNYVSAVHRIQVMVWEQVS
eukprot:GHRQ01024497.1.p2 GENE.GHRQ01024497.1~~GHRQ01024497.1.p2  ORF type:complete len:121 (+),score=29.04 GHRQ01024497.1:459-821(+)